MNIPKPLLTAWALASIAMIEAVFCFDFNIAALYSPVFAARIGIYPCLYFLLRRFYETSKQALYALRLKSCAKHLHSVAAGGQARKRQGAPK